MSMSSRSSLGDNRGDRRTRRTSTHSSPGRKSNLKHSHQKASSVGAPSSSSIHGGLPEELWTSPTIGNRSRTVAQKKTKTDRHGGNSNSFSTTFSGRSGDIAYTGSASAEGAVFTYTKSAAADNYSSTGSRPPREPQRATRTRPPQTSRYTKEQEPSKEPDFNEQQLKKMSNNDIDNIVAKVSELFAGAGNAQTSTSYDDRDARSQGSSKGRELRRNSDSRTTSAKPKVGFAPDSLRGYGSSARRGDRGQTSESSRMEASVPSTRQDISPESSVTDSQSEISAESNEHESADEVNNFSHGLPTRSKKRAPGTRRVRFGANAPKQAPAAKRKSSKKKKMKEDAAPTNLYIPSGNESNSDLNEQMFRLMKLHSTEVKNLKSKHKAEMNRTKKYYKEKLRSLQERQKEVDEMNGAYFARMQTKYEQQIQRLKKLLESETERLNQARAALVQTAQIQTDDEEQDTNVAEGWINSKSRPTSNVSTEQLVQELTKKVTSLQRVMKRKDNELSTLQRKLAENHKKLKSVSEENQQLKQPSLRERQYQHELSEMKEQLANLRRIVYGKSF